MCDSTKISKNFIVRKQLPTIDKLLAVLRADIDFKGSRETLTSSSSTLQNIRQVKKIVMAFDAI